MINVTPQRRSAKIKCISIQNNFAKLIQNNFWKMFSHALHYLHDCWRRLLELHNLAPSLMKQLTLLMLLARCYSRQSQRLLETFISRYFIICTPVGDFRNIN